MALVPRYLRIYDCPDKFTCDICYVDQKTGREIMRYDGADPANTNPAYGAVSDEECFSRKGLDKNEQIEESECVPASTWQNRYVQICNDDWDDYDWDPSDDEDEDPRLSVSFQVVGWDEGVPSGYASADEARKTYSDWSGGFTPEEDGLRVKQIR